MLELTKPKEERSDLTSFRHVGYVKVMLIKPETKPIVHFKLHSVVVKQP